MSRKVIKIPSKIDFDMIKPLNVGIYCRVSSTKQDQLHSLSAQVSYYIKTVLNCPLWKYVDIYIDFDSGASAYKRPELQRLINDCERGIVNTILTKSVSRLGRNTADMLTIVRRFKELNTRIIFELEEIDTSQYEGEFLLTILEAFAQEESYNRSENTKWGLIHGMQSGTSKLYSRKCYGYKKNAESGELEIVPEEAKIVKLIYALYLSGESILSIRRKLESQKILSPSGKEKWCNQAVVNILTNEKYIGNVILGKTTGAEYPSRKRYKNTGQKAQYLASHIHPEIISEETFKFVQDEMKRRSNVVTDENGNRQRAKKRYTFKDASSKDIIIEINGDEITISE